MNDKKVTLDELAAQLENMASSSASMGRSARNKLLANSSTYIPAYTADRDKFVANHTRNNKQTSLSSLVSDIQVDLFGILTGTFTAAILLTMSDKTIEDGLRKATAIYLEHHIRTNCILSYFINEVNVKHISIEVRLPLTKSWVPITVGTKVY